MDQTIGQKLKIPFKEELPNKFVKGGEMLLILTLKKISGINNEERILFELYLKFGSKWAKLKNFFEARNENQLKNRFYSSLRKTRNKIGKLV